MGKGVKNLAWILVSVAVAILIAQSGVVDWLLDFSREVKFLGSLIAGMFFVSIFTAAPSVVVIAEIAREWSPVWVGIFGGLGALLGDLIIFHFIKERLTDNVNLLIEKVERQGFFSIFKSKYFRWLAFFLGAIVIASPLPDELGIAIIGVSKMKTSIFVPLSFVLNGVGIFLVALLGRAF